MRAVIRLKLLSPQSFDPLDLPNPLIVPASLDLSRVGERIRWDASHNTPPGRPNSAPAPAPPQNQ
jgi:hypothetical protein